MNAAERNRVILDMVARPDVLKRQTEAAGRMSNPRLTDRQREGSWGATEAILGVGGEAVKLRRAAEGGGGEEEPGASCSCSHAHPSSVPTKACKVHGAAEGGDVLKPSPYSSSSLTDGNFMTLSPYKGGWLVTQNGESMGAVRNLKDGWTVTSPKYAPLGRQKESLDRAMRLLAAYFPDGARASEAAEGSVSPQEQWWHDARREFPTAVSAYDLALGKMGRSKKSQDLVLEKLRGIETLMSNVGKPFPKVGFARASESAPVLHESAPVLHEPVTVTKGIEWIQVTRDPAEYERWLKQAEKHGPIRNARSIYDLLSPRLSTEDQEIFVVVMTDVRGHLRGVVEVAKGQRSQVVVDPGDVMRPVILSGATAFTLAHNHPSGKCAPSKADRDLLKLMDQANKPYAPGITCLDHVVIGVKEFFSIRENKHYKV